MKTLSSAESKVMGNSNVVLRMICVRHLVKTQGYTTDAVLY